MKNVGFTLTLLVALVLVTSTARAQTLCEAVVIEFVLYNAVDPTSIEVSAFIQDGDCVGYPSFVLYGPTGDTLAMETVNFFCLGLGGPQSHFLDILPGAQVPSAPFEGRLELFTGFGDSLVCSWDLDALDLCPVEECVQAEIYLTNTGELVGFTAYWWVINENGEQVQDGWFDMDEVEHTHFDTVCLPPGTYELGFSPFSPIDESYIIGITPSYQRTIGTNNALVVGGSPWDLSFSWYEACSSGSNSLFELELVGLVLTLENDMMLIIDPDGGPIGLVQIFTADAKMVRSLSSTADRIAIPVGDLASGIHLVKIQLPNNKPFVQRIFIL